MTALAEALDRITVAELRRRGGLKWTYAGPDVLGAFVAEMDFGTAPRWRTALREVIARQDYGYLTPLAARQMAEACAAWLAGRHGWAVDPDWIRPLPDVIKGLEAAITLFSRPGSPVILPTPAYMPFLSVPPLLGREIIQVPMTTAAARAVLDLDGIDAGLPRRRPPAHPVQSLQPGGPGVHPGGTGRGQRGGRAARRPRVRRRDPRTARPTRAPATCRMPRSARPRPGTPSPRPRHPRAGTCPASSAPS